MTSLAFNIESCRIKTSLEISGWAFDTVRQIREVAAIVSLAACEQRVVASFPLHRPDVADAMHAANASLSGFSADGLAALHAADIALDITYADAGTERIPLGRVADLPGRFQQPPSADPAGTSHPPLLIPDIVERFDRRVAASRKLSRPVDIIVPVCRGREFFEDFLLSLLASELQDAAITLVDDGNDDSVVAGFLQSER